MKLNVFQKKTLIRVLIATSLVLLFLANGYLNKVEAGCRANGHSWAQCTGRG